MATIYSVLLAIDGIIYDFICFLYDIFMYLAKTNIFTSEDYNKVVNRLYIILGVVMLFILAYTLLRAVINPDEFSKGDKSFAKIAQNIVVSLIIIAVLPTVFTVAFNIQNSLLTYDSIPKLILGDEHNASGTTSAAGGRAIAYYTFQAFLSPNEDQCTNGNNKACGRENVPGNGSWGATNGVSLAEIDNKVLGGSSFSYYTDYSESVRDHNLTYYFPISTVAGVFLAYVLLNFCFDMALRVIKLCFYQIIAPIPVICRIIPGGKMKDVFGKWVKQIVSLFAEVFVRVGAMSLGIYMIGLLITKWEAGLPKLGTVPLIGRPIVLALLIMSIVMFVRQIPKVIGDLFGLDTGGMKLGLMDKLAQGGGLFAGAVVGGGLGSLARGAVARGKGGLTRARAASAAAGGGFRGVRAAAGSLARTGLGIIGSGVGGGFSGAVRSGYGARNAKNIGDARKAAGTGIANATRARENRDRYRAQHQGANFVDTLGNVAAGHIGDTALNAAAWLGINNDLDALKQAQDFNKQIIAIDDNSDSVAVDLLGRDAFKGSDALMAAASGGTYTMNYAAMQERLTQLRNTDFASVRGRTLTDFQGNTMTINNENDFAQYVASMNSQVGEAERKAKKYIKQQGYAGAAGNATLAAMGITLGDGELQRMAKLDSDRANIQNLVKESQTAIAALNAAQSTTVQVSSVGGYDDMDQLTQNAKNNNIAINAEMERLARENARRHPNNNGGSGGH